MMKYNFRNSTLNQIKLNFLTSDNFLKYVTLVV